MYPGKGTVVLIRPAQTFYERIKLGLVSALRAHFEELSSQQVDARQEMELELSSAGLDNGRLPEDVEIAVYRVVQQGITNAIQHANPDKLRVDLKWTGNELALAIVDDGVGFNPKRVEENPQPGHFGLVNLRDRIEGINERFEIDSTISIGTTVRAQIPTENAASGSGQVQTTTFVLRGVDGKSESA